MADRLVIVSAVQLADLLELVDRVLPTVFDERLRDALVGATAGLTDHLLLEPVPA